MGRTFPRLNFQTFLRPSKQRKNFPNFWQWEPRHCFTVLDYDHVTLHKHTHTLTHVVYKKITSKDNTKGHGVTIHRNRPQRMTMDYKGLQ